MVRVADWLWEGILFTPIYSSIQFLIICRPSNRHDIDIFERQRSWGWQPILWRLDSGTISNQNGFPHRLLLWIAELSIFWECCIMHSPIKMSLFVRAMSQSALMLNSNLHLNSVGCRCGSWWFLIARIPGCWPLGIWSRFEDQIISWRDRELYRFVLNCEFVPFRIGLRRGRVSSCSSLWVHC